MNGMRINGNRYESPRAIAVPLLPIILHNGEKANRCIVQMKQFGRPFRALIDLGDSNPRRCRWAGAGVPPWGGRRDAGGI